MAAPSVNKPTNVKEKEDDVNRKLQLYGIYSAFQAGKVPSNDQIDVALNSFLASKPIANPSDKLSAEGQTLVSDVREVVRQAKLLLLSKNEGNLLQDFVWQTTQFDPKSISAPNVPVNKDEAQEHGNQALSGLRTLGTLIITNGQFRKLLKDATILLRDMAGDAATNVASKVRPSPEDLSQIDHPAQDNTWHDTPNLSKENMKKQVQGVYKGNPSDDASTAVASGASAAHPTGSSDPQALATTAVANKQNGAATGIDSQAGLNATKNTLDDRVNANIPEETKENVRQRQAEYRARTKEYLSKKVPEERRDQIVWRLKKMVLECQQHPDYQEAIETLITLAEEYGSHANTLTKGTGGTVQDTRSALATAEADLKTLIERFANGTSTDDLWASINTIYDDANRDEELKEWFRSMDRYVRRLLQEQGYIIDKTSTNDWNRLYDRGNYLLRQKYRNHTDRIVDEIKFLVDQFDQDAQNKAFGQALQKLFNDLGNDENGKPTFKPHLVKDLTEIILPQTFEKIAYIPIPRIEYSDSQIDAVVENLVLESDNFMPNIFELTSDNYFRWGRKNIASKHRNSIEVSVKGVQMDLRDVSYYVKRKQGFPSLTDNGVADILMYGDGFTFKIKMSTADAKDAQNFFKVDKVEVNIKNLKIKLSKSKHKFLFNTFKPIMLKVLRPAIQKAAGKTIKDQVHRFDSILWQIKLEADRALEDGRQNPDEVPNLYKRYTEAFQKRMLQGKQKAEALTADKKVNMAVLKEESMFPDINLEGGISAKASEYREVARKGEKWESPVFSIGNAPKSSDIPAAPKIERKPHGGQTTRVGDMNGDYRNPVGGSRGGAMDSEPYGTGRPLGQTYTTPVGAH